MATARKRTTPKAAPKAGARKRTSTPSRAGTARKAAKPGKTATPRKATRTLGAARARTSATARKTAPLKKRAPARQTVAPRPAPRFQNPVTWFEIPVRDIQRARAFYERVLRVTLAPQDMGTFKMAFFPAQPDGLGTGGALMQAETYTPSHDGAMVYFSVADILGTLERVGANGGQVVNPKMSIGQFGFVAHFQDCEGNRVALHSMQ